MDQWKAQYGKQSTDEWIYANCPAVILLNKNHIDKFREHTKAGITHEGIYSAAAKGVPGIRIFTPMGVPVFFLRENRRVVFQDDVMETIPAFNIVAAFVWVPRVSQAMHTGLSNKEVDQYNRNILGCLGIGARSVVLPEPMIKLPNTSDSLAHQVWVWLSDATKHLTTLEREARKEQHHLTHLLYKVQKAYHICPPL